MRNDPLSQYQSRYTPRDLMLRAAFGIMLVLMAILAGVGALSMRETQQRIERMVHLNFEMTDLASHMYRAARERTIALQGMLLVTDPFEREEHRNRYYEAGGEFVTAREKLRTLIDSDAERQLLEKQGRITQMAVPLQDTVVELVARGRQQEAHRLLLDRAIPLQNEVLSTLREMYDLQERRAEEAVQAAQVSYRQALWLMGGLLATTFGIGIMLARRVVRRTRTAELALRQEKERAQVTLFSMSEGVIRTSATGLIEFMNPLAERLMACMQADALGQSLPQVLRLRHEISHAEVTDPVAECLRTGDTVTDTGDILFLRRDGIEGSIEYTVRPIMGEDGAIEGAVVVFRDVTEMRALSRELVYQATHDQLTGILNRREFERRVLRAIEDTRLLGNSHALCYIDLDLFKMVNDTCGHVAGDELLKQLAQLLVSRIRREDVLARIGGDEFAVLLQRCTMDEAARVTEHVRQAIRGYRFSWDGKTIDVGASIGVVVLDSLSGDLNDVFRMADMACRIAKEEGRNRVHVHRAQDQTVTHRQREIDWVHNIKQALENDLFQLCGQWIRPLGARTRPTHCEVLLRLPDATGAIATPASFIAAAERYHLMPQLDRWTLDKTLQILRKLPSGHAGCFNINLSGQTLCDPEFLGFAREKIHASGVSAKHLCFEITESAAVTHMSRATQLIAALRALGCRFALDDFGAGLSSFTYLKHMTVDYLKIDGTFVRSAPDDPTDLAMVNSINQVAHILGIETVAEHVETEAIRQAMERLGADYGQGYFLAVPESLDGLVSDLRPSNVIRLRTPG